MNPTSADPIAPQPPQPPRSSFSCDRHPSEQFTGFCPSCLCERLTTLDQSSSNTPSSSHRPSSASAAAAAAIKSLFSSNPKPTALAPPPPQAAPRLPKPSFFPVLRRTKSFSASKNEALGVSFEPQRKSCDVRARNTLSSLFTLDYGSKTTAGNSNQNISKTISVPTSSISSTSHQNPQNANKIECFVVNKPVLEETENEEDFKDPEYLHDPALVYDDDSNDDGDVIMPVRDTHLVNLRNSAENVPTNTEIVKEEVTASISNILKPMKDHIDLSTQEKKSSGSGFWAAASVFSKKWQKWRQKQKTKKPPINDGNFSSLLVKKPVSGQFRETHPETTDYCFGRRSCDMAQRFSLDTARISLDEPKYSFDEPRASWDGHLIGRSFPRMPPMVSVMEDSPQASARHISRSDMQIPVEGSLGNLTNNSENVPGGSIQTMEYYLDSSSRRRKSLDRSNSIRKAMAVGSEAEELRSVSNAKVSPASTDCTHRAEVMAGENDNMNFRGSSVSRDDCSETFELGSGVLGDSGNFLVGSVDKKEPKKSRRWSWRIWGFSFIQRRSSNSNGTNNNCKDEYEDEKHGRANGVERSFSESWHDLRMENGDSRGQFSRNMFRSNSSVSWRNGNHQIGGPGLGSGPFGSMRISSAEMNGRKKKAEFVLEKNRSARYSVSDIVDNGLLRFYMAPMRNSRKEGFKPSNSHPIARSLRLY